MPPGSDLEEPIEDGVDTEVPVEDEVDTEVPVEDGVDTEDVGSVPDGEVLEGGAVVDTAVIPPSANSPQTSDAGAPVEGVEMADSTAEGNGLEMPESPDSSVSVEPADAAPDTTSDSWNAADAALPSTQVAAYAAPAPVFVDTVAQGPVGVVRVLFSIFGWNGVIGPDDQPVGAPPLTALLWGAWRGFRTFFDNRAPMLDPVVAASDPISGKVTGDLRVTDRDGEVITVSVTDAPDHGQLDIDADGRFVYTPDVGFAGGVDTFVVHATDGRTGVTETVTITVLAAPNQAPTAHPDTAQTPAGTPVTINVLANDTDPDNDTLTITAVSTPTNGGGTVTFTATTVTYTPATGYTGTDTFTYTITDGVNDPVTGTVTITVLAPPNQAPTAHPDTAQTPAGTPVTINVLANDTDPDNDTLTVTAVSTPTNGTVTFTATTVTYTPAGRYSGTDTFTYTITDGVNTPVTVTVTVTVTAVNQAPTAHPDTAQTPAGTPVTIDMLANDTDPDNDTLTVTGVSTPTNGTVTFTATTVTYTPAAGFSGTDSFTYTITDGVIDPVTGTVTVTVLAAPNTAPTLIRNGTDINKPITGPATFIYGSPDADGDTVVITISKPDHGTLQAGFGAVINPDGSATITDGTITNGGLVTYTVDPAYAHAAAVPGAPNTDTITVTADDGHGGITTQTLNLTIAGVNTAPTLIRNGTNPNNPITGPATFIYGSPDADGDTVIITIAKPDHGTLQAGSNAVLNPDGSVTIYGSLTNGGVVTYTVDPAYAHAAAVPGAPNTDTITVTADDGHGGITTQTLNLTIAPTPPVAGDVALSTPEDTAVSGTVSISDLNGGSVTVTVVNNPAHGVLNLSPDGAFIYTPNTDFNGTDSFTYIANNGAANSNTATVTVTVTAVNDSPVAGDVAWSPADPVTGEVHGTLNFTDPDGDPLTYTPNSGTTSRGAYTVDPVGNVTYTPTAAARYAASADGASPEDLSDTFVITADDGNGATTQTTVNVAIEPAPNALPTIQTTITRDGSVHTITIITNDADQADIVTHEIIAGPSEGDLTSLHPACRTSCVESDDVYYYVYTGPSPDNWRDSFTIRASDGHGGTVDKVVFLAYVYHPPKG